MQSVFVILTSVKWQLPFYRCSSVQLSSVLQVQGNAKYLGAIDDPLHRISIALKMLQHIVLN